MHRKAFSLLEILLALAILGGSLAVLSQIIGTGIDSASSARDLALAQMICQAKLADTLISGVTPVTVPSTPTAAPDTSSNTPFTYEITVGQGPLSGMLVIRVTVEAQDLDGGPPIATYSLTRWMIDPSLGLAEAEEQVKADKAAKAEAAAAGAS